MNVVRLSALRTGRLYPQGNIPGTHFFQRLSQPQNHSAVGKIISMKNFHDTIGNRTRDFPACSAVPQPTAPLRAPRHVTTIHETQCSLSILTKVNQSRHNIRLYVHCA